MGHGGLAEPGACAGTPGCQPSRLGRRPGSQRRGRGGKAGGNGRSAGRFARRTHPARLQLTRGFAGDPRGAAAKERPARLGVSEWGFGTPRTPRAPHPARCPRAVGPAPETGRPCPGLHAPALASRLGSTFPGWSGPPTPASCPRDSRGKGAEAPGKNSGDRSDLGGSTGLRGEALPRAEEGQDPASLPRASRGSDGRQHPWATRERQGPLGLGTNRPQGPSAPAPSEFSRPVGASGQNRGAALSVGKRLVSGSSCPRACF